MAHGRKNLLTQGNLLIVWGERHMTGIAIADEQHRGIVSIINSLYYSRFSPKKENLLRATNKMILGYTKIHFKDEMELLKDSGYPQFNEHQAQHDHLIAESDRMFHACLEEGGDPGPYLRFLKDWWQNHILHEDMAYVGHLLNYLHSGRQVVTKTVKHRPAAASHRRSR